MRIPAGEKRKLANRRASKREELVEEKNRREGKNAINITYIQKTHKQGEFYAQKVLRSCRRLDGHLFCMPWYRRDRGRGFEKTMPKM